jgi:hypothetical protein
MVTQQGQAEASGIVRSSVEKVRPADTDAYAAEDVISESATNGAGTPWILTGLPPAGYITAARIHTKKASVTAALTAFLFNALPTSELDDNAANTAPDYEDLASYVGKIDFPGMEDLGGDSSWAQATPSTAGGLPLPYRCAYGEHRLWAIVVTRDAFTPDSAQKFTLAIEVDRA